MLDMEVDSKAPLILGKLFLTMGDANIDVGAWEVQLNINGQTEKFAFRPKVEQCFHVKTFNRRKSEKEQKKTSTPSLEDNKISLI